MSKKGYSDRKNRSSRPGTAPAALVTGASSGIGRELARVFYAHGYDLVLVSRNEESLNSLAKELEAANGGRVWVIPADLSLEGAAERLYADVRFLGVKVDVLVNNAGAGCCGLFHEMDMDRIRSMMKLDMEELTGLTRLFSGDMVERGGGRILNVASTGSWQPGPYIAVYYAAKAYVLSLSLALASELEDKGITVTALCPGATRTGFSDTAGKADIPNAMNPLPVALAGFKGTMKGKRVVIPGVQNKLAVAFSRFLPGSFNAVVVKRIQKEMITRRQPR